MNLNTVIFNELLLEWDKELNEGIGFGDGYTLDDGTGNGEGFGDGYSIFGLRFNDGYSFSERVIFVSEYPDGE